MELKIEPKFWALAGSCSTPLVNTTEVKAILVKRDRFMGRNIPINYYRFEANLRLQLKQMTALSSIKLGTMCAVLVE
jgi:hypothetical protein